MRAAFPETRSASQFHNSRWRWSFFGFLCGIGFSLAANSLGVQVVTVLGWLTWWPIAACAGLTLGATRSRWLLPLACLGTWALYFFVSSSSWASHALQDLAIRDRLAKSDAVVVLASDILPDGTPVPQSQRRLNHAYQLMQQGYGKHLVLTRFRPPRPSYLSAVKQQLRQKRLNFSVLETAEIRYTPDEARAVAQLVKTRHWQRVILVTDPAHTRRATALFRKAGVKVLCSPCVVPLDAPTKVDSPAHRLTAFQIWLYEKFYFQVHRALGQV